MFIAKADDSTGENGEFSLSAARTARREHLCSLFSETLSVPQWGVHDSFLDLDGQSVIAMLIISRINSDFGASLTAADLFDAPTVADLDDLLENHQPVPDQQNLLADTGSRPSVTSADGPHEHVPEQEFPLSFNQEFLCAFDKGDDAGTFGERHILVDGWRIAGEADAEVLQAALDDVVARHEILRTLVSRDPVRRCQVVYPPTSATLEIRQLSAGRSRESSVEEFLAEAEAGTLSARNLPLLKAILGKIDDKESVLALVTHHCASDPWSMQLIMRDLLACYTARRSHQLPALPEARQYREFAIEQRSRAADAMRAAAEYWRVHLEGGEIFTFQKDRVSSDGGCQGMLYESIIDAQVTAAAKKLARETGSSLFMVMLAAFWLIGSRQAGTTDLAIPTFTSGRNDPSFGETVGFVVNYLPIRADIADCKRFLDVIAKVRQSCIGAYVNDIPFALIDSVAPDLHRSYADPVKAGVVFEMLQSPPAAGDGQIGDIAFSQIRRRPLGARRIFDTPGIVWVLDSLPSGETGSRILFNGHEFDESTIGDLASSYQELLAAAVAYPDRVPALLSRAE
jgi:condensation enzyme